LFVKEKFKARHTKGEVLCGRACNPSPHTQPPKKATLLRDKMGAKQSRNRRLKGGELSSGSGGLGKKTNSM